MDPGSEQSIKALCRTAIARITGHRPEDLSGEMHLEADLGLDSIKMVELFTRLLQEVPPARHEQLGREELLQDLMRVETVDELMMRVRGVLQDGPARPTAAPAPANSARAPESAGSSDRDTVRSAVLEAVCKISGHQPADLSEDMALEADVGLDSIKMVQALNELSRSLPGAANGAEQDLGRLLQLQTVGDLVEAAVRLAAASGDDGRTELSGRGPDALRQAQGGGAGRDAPWKSNAEPGTLLVAEAQYPFLVASVSGASLCSLCSRVRVRGRLDPDLATAAWADLVERHPILRSRFVAPEGAGTFADYRLELVPDAAVPRLRCTSLVGKDRVEQERALRSELESALARTWDLGRWPLQEISAYQLSSDEWELRFENHHLVSDGLGNQRIVREFLEGYAARASGTPRIERPAASARAYNDAVAALDAWPEAGEDAALDAFLRDLGGEKFLWNGKGRKPTTGTVHASSRLVRLDARTTAALVAKVRAFRIPLNSLLVAGFLRALDDVAVLPGRAILNIPTGGRAHPGADVTDLLGCFAQNLVLAFDRPRTDETWLELCRRVDAAISEAIGGGLDRAQVRRAARACRQLRAGGEAHVIPVSALVRASSRSNVYLPFIGQTRIERRYGPLEVLEYQASTTTNPATVDTVLEIFDGALQLSANFDREFFAAGEIEALLHACTRRLADLAQATEAVPLKAVSGSAGSPTAERLAPLFAQVCHRPISTRELQADLEADLGFDSLDRVRMVHRLSRAHPHADRQRLMACRSIAEMAAVVGGGGAGEGAGDLAEDVLTSPRALPYLRFSDQARLRPDETAVLDPGGSLSYRELDELSNRLARALAREGVAPRSLVGLLVRPSAEMIVGLLGILKAGCAYVPLDPEYPAARLAYIADHAGLQALVSEGALVQELLGRIDPEGHVRRVFLTKGAAGDRAVLELGRWRLESASPVEVTASPEDPMTVLYTSGSTGRPKGVRLNHRGYMNRLVWHQKQFELRPGERVAQKTSCCFDISVWELLWPLMYGGTVCPVARSVVRDPWLLAEWMRSTRINVMHFVPSLFAEFVQSFDGETSFPDLRWLVFSGEALPAGPVRTWFERCGDRVQLANLYGPTEASIDVSCQVVVRKPEPDERIPIGAAIDNVELLVLDPGQRPLPDGEIGELWIGGVQLATGYLNQPDLTAERFRSVPSARSPVLYRTGDLASRTSDGAFHYHGRLDSQVKVRGFRVELGEIEAALGAIEGVREAAVLAVDEGDGKLRLVAYASVSRPELDGRALREAVRQKLPDYMVPQRVELLASLPRNANGKLDRAALQAGKAAREAPPAGTAVEPAGSAGRIARGAEPRDHGRSLVHGAQQVLPLGPAQRWIFRHFDPPHAWFGYSRFRYGEPLDLELLERALSAAVDRHPALRTTFSRGAGVWRQVVQPPGCGLPVTVIDCGPMSEEEREAEIRRLIEDACREMSIEGGPLFRVSCVELPGGRHEVVVVGHHLNADLVSNQILFEEVWASYARLRAGADAAAEPSPPPSYGDYVERLEALRADGTLARHAAWYRDRFEGKPAFVLSADGTGGPNVESSAATLIAGLGEDSSRTLQGQARGRFDGSVYHLLVASLYSALAEFTGQRRVVLSHRSHGRDPGLGMAFVRSVGNFAVNYPVALEIDPSASWAERVRAVREALAAVPANGVTYDLVGDDLPPSLYPDDKLTPVRVNYLGNRTAPRNALFEFVEAHRDQRFAFPDQRRTCLVEVFLLFEGGRLRVEVSHSTRHHRPETMRALLDLYVRKLEELLHDRLASASPGAGGSPRSAGPALRRGVRSDARPLDGKTAIVTGGGRGIGRETALELARRGARVVIAARTRTQLDACVREIAALDGEALGVEVDVAHLEDVERLVAAAVERFQGIDILVNNAGVTALAPLVESDPADWRRIVEVNLFGAYHACRAALPHIRRRGGGKVVNVGSDSSFIGYPLLSAYAASKHALVGMTKALAEEVKLQGIQVNAVCPAMVDTDMAPRALRGEALSPTKVAQTIAFLASPESDGITGETIKIFGTQDMYWYGSRKMALVKAAARGPATGAQREPTA